MIKGFEEAFMEAQSGAVSLVLEMLEDNLKEIDKIYIYMYQNSNQLFCNTFFSKGEKIIRTNELIEDYLVSQYLKCATDDLKNIIKICQTYEMKCSHEFKLIYDVNNGKFDSEYKYDEVEAKDGIEYVYMDWRSEIGKKISSTMEA